MTLRLRNKQVVVIGGGISGLAAAFHIMRKGIRVRVLECAARPGGLVRSERQEGFLMEHAATCIFNFLPEVDLFCQSLGLDAEMALRRPAAKRRYLLKDGQLTPVPMTFLSFLGSRLISPMGKIRLTVEPFIPRGSQDNWETVADFITRRFGREFYEQAIEPYVSGTLAGDAERACLRSVFKQLAILEEEHGSIVKGAMLRKWRGIRTVDCKARVFSFTQGMATLTDAVARQLGKDFLPGREVQSIERQGTRWCIEATQKGGGAETYTADAVVIATSATVAGKLTQPLSPDLGLLLSGLPYSPMAISYLGFRRQVVDHALDGIGCLVPHREKDFKLLGSLWPTTLFTQRAAKDNVLFMNYLGGARRPAMMKKTDAELTQISLNDTQRIIKTKETPIFSHVIRHKHALPQYNIGHPMFLSGLEDNLKHLPGLFLSGNYLNGVSIRACISNGIEIAQRVELLLKSSKNHLPSSTVPTPQNLYKTG